MKFTSLTAMILSATSIAGTVVTAQIIGHPCAHANEPECGQIEGHNHDNQFLFLCGPDYTIIDYEDCSCEGCCYIDLPYAQCF
ncbi:hypothetical protein DFH29DRAFT_140232 [Suillus ampliporus]|nr:hypothetical protein DFH29DRAFT_140232 [Suillus ampliporus]